MKDGVWFGKCWKWSPRPEPLLNFKLRDVKEQLIYSDRMKGTPPGCFGSVWYLQPMTAPAAHPEPEACR